MKFKTEASLPIFTRWLRTAEKHSAKLQHLAAIVQNDMELDEKEVKEWYAEACQYRNELMYSLDVVMNDTMYYLEIMRTKHYAKISNSKSSSDESSALGTGEKLD